MYHWQAVFRTMRPKKFCHSSRVGGFPLASLACLLPPLPLSAECRRDKRLRGEGACRGAPSPLSLPSIPTSGIESPLLNSGGTSAPSPLKALSDGNGSDIPSSSTNSPTGISVSSSSELMAMRGSLGSRFSASAASGVIPGPCIGCAGIGNHYFPRLVVSFAWPETFRDCG